MPWADTHIHGGPGPSRAGGEVTRATAVGPPRSRRRSQVQLARPLTCARWIGAVVPEPFVPGDKVPPVLKELREVAALPQPRDRQLNRPGAGVPLAHPEPLREFTRSGVTSPYPALQRTSTSASIIFCANPRIISRSTSGLADSRVCSNLSLTTGTMSRAATLFSFVSD